MQCDVVLRRLKALDRSKSIFSSIFTLMENLRRSAIVSLLISRPEFLRVVDYLCRGEEGRVRIARHEYYLFLESEKKSTFC